MSSLIEQAAQRLAQIREAGIALPGEPVVSAAAVASDAASPAAPRVEPAPVPQAATVTSKEVLLDLAALTAESYLVPSAPRSHMGDQYRVIKRPLIANATGKGSARAMSRSLLNRDR